MSEPILSVENVSKCYRLYTRPQDRLREALDRKRRSFHRDFWALQDISFELKRGEALGIIGRNGAGKSTLLQILSGTLAPTSGRIRVRGRISALLELGSGFNPEYTGRDNVFLYGSILGFTRAHVAERFDEIAAFADIGEHLELPAKTYSSGMVVRLAFSVITLLEPEILIADEWLAVGDMQFQTRCLKVIKKLISDGMTLILVSHNPTAVQLFTDRCLWLDDGRTRALGGSVDVAQDYTHAMMAAESSDDADATGEVADSQPIDDVRFSTNGELHLTDVRFIDESGKERSEFRTGDHLRIAMDYVAHVDVEDAVFAVSVFSHEGTYCCSMTSKPGELGARLNGTGTALLDIPNLPLNSGEYRLSAAVLDSKCVFYFDHHRPRYQLSVRSDRPTWGIVSVTHSWSRVAETTPQLSAGGRS